MSELLGELDTDLLPAYESLPDFRGLLVLEKADGRSHVIALSLWEEEAGPQASDLLGEEISDRVALATGASVSRSAYTVRRMIGMDDVHLAV